jgi:hypothetical protein
MSNLLYPKFKEAALSGNINLPTADIRAIMCDFADYTYSPAHQYLNQVPLAARVGVSGSLTGKTVTDGVFDADDTTILAVSGDPIEGVLLYIHTGTESTSRLVSLHDHNPDGVTPISFTPSGTNVLITWPNDAGRIFAL